jgi:LPPG:FO 2-phospho-L-lactate transferase
MIAALAGGVGAARFLSGLIAVVKAEDLTIIVNTGDDIDLYGLHISPDIDIVTYTLAGIVDSQKGWGVQGDTFHCLDMIRKYGYETWFNLGDKDLATHIHRTSLLGEGLTLAEVTNRICRSLGLNIKILPMTDDRFETRIIIDEGSIHFQEYLVKRKTRDKVLGVEFVGVENSKPAPGVLDSITNAKGLIVCPSNPIVSIGTILSVKDIRELLKQTSAKKIAISPLVGGAPIKGPADKLMKGLGLEVSAFGVANLYKDFLDTFILDTIDHKEKSRIEELGIKVVVTNTIMKSLEDKIRLAEVVVNEIQ